MVVNGTSSRHLALVGRCVCSIPAQGAAGMKGSVAGWVGGLGRDRGARVGEWNDKGAWPVQGETGLPDSLVSLSWRRITISLATQEICPLVTAPGSPAFCSASSVRGVIPGVLGFPKKKLDHQCPESCLGRPGW